MYIPKYSLLSLYNNWAYVFTTTIWYWMTKCCALPWRRHFFHSQSSLLAYNAFCRVDAFPSFLLQLWVNIVVLGQLMLGSQVYETA